MYSVILQLSSLFLYLNSKYLFQAQSSSCVVISSFPSSLLIFKILLIGFIWVFWELFIFFSGVLFYLHPKLFPGTILCQRHTFCLASFLSYIQLFPYFCLPSFFFLIPPLSSSFVSVICYCFCCPVCSIVSSRLSHLFSRLQELIRSFWSDLFAVSSVFNISSCVFMYSAIFWLCIAFVFNLLNCF